MRRKITKDNYINRYYVHYENGDVGKILETKKNFEWYPPNESTPLIGCAYSGINHFEEWKIQYLTSDMIKIEKLVEIVGVAEYKTVIWEREELT